MDGQDPTRSSRDVEPLFQAFDAWDDCEAITDESGEILRCNRAWKQIFGKEKRHLGDLLPEAFVKALLLEPGSQTPTSVHIGSSGGPHQMNVKVKRNANLIFLRLTDTQAPAIAGGDEKSVMATTILLLEEAGVIGSLYDPDNDCVVLTSAFPDADGLARTQVPRALVDSMMHPDDRSDVVALRDQLAREGGRSVSEIRADLASGERLHLKVLQRAGRRLPSGRFEVVSVNQDVTELAMARDEAKTTARQLGMALKAANAGVFEVDYQSERVYCSPSFKRIFGREFEIGDVYSHRRETPNGERVTDRTQRAGLTDNALDIEVSVQGADRWVRLYTEISHAADGSPLHAVGLVLDIDRAKRQELALQTAQMAAQSATEAKSQFLASMSHEIRTPMNGIVGVLHLLKGETLSIDGRSLLGEALACSDMLLQLINDLLDFSKIEAGKLEIAPEPTRAAEVLKGVVALLRPQAEGKGLALASSMEPGRPVLLTDPVRLRQCLFNLVGNAVKFTDRGEVSVRMSQPREARLRIEVTDTGPGIPEPAQARLFQRFEQADTAATRAHGGTGLGLAITRSLVELMGGEIGLISREGYGSTFWFEIDAPPVADVGFGAAEASASDDLLEGVRMLVVDDNAVNRLVAMKMLEAFGAVVDAAADGLSAIDAARTTAYDLILMDVNMPGMDGLEATRQIRAQPNGQIPIVALTADVMAHQRAQYLASGMDGAVPKPFSPAVLLQEIVRVLSDADEAKSLSSTAVS